MIRRDVPVLDHLRKGAVAGFARGTCGHHRQPVALVPAGAAAKVGQLDHHRAALFVAVVGQPLHPADHFVLVGEDIVEDRRAVLGHRRRSGGHGQRHACLGPFQMVKPVAVLGHPVLGVGRFVACRHDPVLQRQMLQLIGLQQRVVRLAHRGLHHLEETIAVVRTKSLVKSRQELLDARQIGGAMPLTEKLAAIVGRQQCADRGRLRALWARLDGGIRMAAAGGRPSRIDRRGVADHGAGIGRTHSGRADRGADGHHGRGRGRRRADAVGRTE